MEELKERFKEFVGKVFEELGVLVDEFDFEFSETINELYREITQKKSIFKKFEEVDFILEVPLKYLGRVPYESYVLFPSSEDTEKALVIYNSYKLEDGIFVEDLEATSYGIFGGDFKNPLVLMKFRFTKSSYLSDTFIQKYVSKGCNHYRTSLDHYENLNCQCVNLKFSFKNLNMLI
jgi:hypothetical protein